MSLDQNIERASKILRALSDIAKGILIIGLLWVGYTALTSPQQMGEKLRDLRKAGVDVNKLEIDLPFLRIGASVFHALEATATAQVKTAAAQELSLSNPTAEAKLQEASASLAQVQSTIAQQAREIRAAAAAAGIVESVPATGWILVGFVASNGSMRILSDRIDPKDLSGLRVENGKVSGLTKLTLRFDAAVAQGDECIRVPMENVSSAAEVANLLPKIMLAGDPTKPLEVTRAEQCESRSKEVGSIVYAQVKIPPDRVLAVAR
jgi:hypothetical protein